MKKQILFLFLVLGLIYITACAPAQQPQPTAPKQEPVAQPKQTVTQPTATIQPKTEISAEVQELFDKSKTRVKSIKYKYKGPETGDQFYDFFIKDTKIRYNPYLAIKTLDKQDSYDSIFIDKTAKTAASYCLAAYCAYKGKKQDLGYSDAYIPTVFDWITGLTKAAKIGEEVIDSRSTWKVDTSKGILWVDAFYGIPLKGESSGKSYRFQQLSVNVVQDSDVVPS
mgnify:FL=1